MKKLLLPAVLCILQAPCVQAGNQFGVYINEVLYDPVGSNSGTQKIEIINRSAVTVNLSTWSICIQFNYKRFPTSPAAMIPPGGLYTIHVNATGANTPTEMYTGAYVNLDPLSDAVALYHTFSGFATAANMEDFVQYGAGGQQRENVAATAGLWTAGTFVPLGAEGQSLAYNGSMTLPHPLTDYCNEAPTIGSANQCGSVVYGDISELRIHEVLADPVGDNTGATLVELVNTSSLPVELEGLSLCWQFVYYDVPAGTVVPAGSLVVLHINASGTDIPTDVYTGGGIFPDLNPAGDSFAIYRNNLDYSDPAHIIDFFQWGNAGQAREDVAQAAAIWTAGDYFPMVLPESDISYQWLSGSGNASTDYCADAQTIGSGNVCTTSGTPVPPPIMVTLHQNHPNPFNPVTRLAVDVFEDQDRLSVTIFDVLGTPVRVLRHGPARFGRLHLDWDGRDARGRALPGGVYVYAVETASGTISRKMTLAR